MIKKLISFILVLAMLASFANVVTYANPVGFQESYVSTTSEWITADEMAILNKVGASPWSSIEGMNGRDKEVVSRWIMCYFLNRMVELDTTKPAGFETLFTDLTSEHKYYNLIKGAVKAGYMNGYPDGSFRPDIPISTMEAADVCLRVLGYGPYIEVLGRDKALNKTDILDGIPVSDSMTQPQLMKMFYNMLNSPAVNAVSFSKDENGTVVDYSIDETYLGFEHLYGVIHKTAVLDGVEGTTLNDSTREIKSGTVTIAGVTYAYDGDAKDLLGYRVNYFYKKASGDIKEILHIGKSEKNEELVLTHDMIEDYSDGVYTYLDGDKEKEIKITAETKVIYNGIANPRFTDEELVPDYGTVTFIDYDGKKGYEVVKITEYDFYVISALDQDDTKVYDNEGNSSRILDLKGVDSLTISNGEKVIAFDRLKKGNMLVVKRSSANSSYDIVDIEMLSVANKGIQIKSVREETVKSATAEYAVWDKIINEIQLGKTYNFYTFEGTVVYAIEDTTVGPEYAFLVSMAPADDNPFATATRWAVMDMNGNLNTYEGAEKIYIDGIKLSDPARMETALNVSAAMSNGYSAEYPLSQPIRIDFNSEGEVNRVDTFTYNADSEDEYTMKNVPEDDGNMRYDYYASGMYGLDENNRYTKLAGTIGTSTVRFTVPVDRFDADLYATGELDDTTTYTAVDVVGRNEDSWIADAMFFYSTTDDGNITNTTRTSIIADKLMELSEDGEIICTLSCFFRNTAVTYTCDEEFYNQASIGDIYKFDTNKKNEIVAYKKIYDINDEFPARGSRVDATIESLAKASYRGTIYGSLVHVDGNIIRVTEALPTDVEPYDPLYNTDNFTIGSAGIYKYTNVRGVPTVEKVGIAEAIPYTTDKDNPSMVILNVMRGVNQVYIIEKGVN